jgi:hypothetical protein
VEVGDAPDRVGSQRFDGGAGLARVRGADDDQIGGSDGISSCGSRARIVVSTSRSMYGGMVPGRDRRAQPPVIVLQGGGVAGEPAVDAGM